MAKYQVQSNYGYGWDVVYETDNEYRALVVLEDYTASGVGLHKVETVESV